MFPKIETNKDQKLWLQKLYESLKERKQPDVRVIKSSLRGQIPNDFDHQQINWKLAPGGWRISILGVWHVDPQSIYLVLFEKALYEIQKILIAKPTTENIALDTLAKSLKCNLEDLTIALEFLSDFNSSCQIIKDANSQDQYIGSKIHIGNLPGFDFFYKFVELQDLIGKWFNPKDENRFAPPINSEKAAYSAPNTAFILMAMDKSKPDLEDTNETIKEVCRKFGIEAKRADDFEHSERITDVILNEISSSEFIIADLTGERPNVYYEIGFAHALGKRPILYRKENTKLHFDLSVHNVPEYKNNKELKELLSNRLEAILGRKPNIAT